MPPFLEFYLEVERLLDQGDTVKVVAPEFIFSYFLRYKFISERKNNKTGILFCNSGSGW